MQQLIFMFYTVPTGSFNTPDGINNSGEGGKEGGRARNGNDTRPTQERKVGGRGVFRSVGLGRSTAGGSG